QLGPARYEEPACKPPFEGERHVPVVTRDNPAAQGLLPPSRGIFKESSMMPFHPSFRFLLRKYIPQVANEDLDRHESLMALRLQLKLERNMPPGTPTPDYRQAVGESSRDLRNRLIREATVQANGTDGTGVFSGFEREFNAVHRLWTARRQLAL